MKKIYLKLIITAWILAMACKNKEAQICNFDYKRLMPSSVKCSSERFKFEYMNDRLVSVKFSDAMISFDDTVIYHHNDFLLVKKEYVKPDLKQSDSSFAISGKIDGEVLTFMIGKNDKNFLSCGFVAKPLNDSIINIRFLRRSGIYFESFSPSVINSMFHYKDSSEYYDTYEILKYKYLDTVLVYKIIYLEGDRSAERPSFDTLFKSKGNMYYDIEEITKLHYSRNYLRN